MYIITRLCHRHLYNYEAVAKIFVITKMFCSTYIIESKFSRCEVHRGKLSYLAPLGSENISAPYFKQCFFRGGGGGITPPPDWVKHHASQSQERNNKYFILYIEFCVNNKI